VRAGGANYGLATVMLLLLLLHFGLRPLLGYPRIAPDFLLLALMLYAIGARPGNAAIAGFLVGLWADALTPVAFGAGAMAYTVIAYLAAWGKAVFFADNLFVNAAIFFAGVWVRDGFVLLVSGNAENNSVLWQLGYWAPLLALTTSIVGVVVLLVFRNWLHVRIGE